MIARPFATAAMYPDFWLNTSVERVARAQS